MDLSYFSEILKYKDWIAIYFNRKKTDKFLAGELLTFDSDSLVLSLFAPDASADGVCFCSAKFLFRIEQDTQYMLALKKKIALWSTPHLEGDPWKAFLKYAEANQFVTQVKGFSGKRLMFGVPLAHSQNTVTFRRVYADGTLGKALRINRNRIAMLVCNSDTERPLQTATKKGVDPNA